MPYDGVIIYVDDVTRGQLSDKTKFEQLKIEVGPGPHKITFAYAHNPVDLDALPPKPDGVEHVGAVYIDDVYFLPSGVTVAPTVVTTPSPTVSVSPTRNQDTAPPVRVYLVLISSHSVLQVINSNSSTHFILYSDTHSHQPRQFHLHLLQKVLFITIHLSKEHSQMIQNGLFPLMVETGY